jgi:hypothetical protein
MNFDCSDCDDEIRGQVNFSTDIEPMSQIYSVGDTIMLNTELSSIFDFESSADSYDNSNLPIINEIKLFEGLQGEINMIPARDQFELIVLNGALNLPERRDFIIQVTNDCDDVNCLLTFGLVPRRSGYFGMAMGNGAADMGDCINITLKAEEFRTNSNNNFEIFEEIDILNVRIDGGIYNNDNFNKLTYFFKVAE